MKRHEWHAPSGDDVMRGAGLFFVALAIAFFLPGFVIAVIGDETAIFAMIFGFGIFTFGMGFLAAARR